MRSVWIGKTGKAFGFVEGIFNYGIMNLFDEYLPVDPISRINFCIDGVAQNDVCRTIKHFKEMASNKTVQLLHWFKLECDALAWNIFGHTIANL